MTSDGEILFRAVCEHPADDTPRLVYADWLEENGQPERAEFIRLQCEDREFCRRFPDLAAARTRASDLLRVHGRQWEMELPLLRGVSWGSHFVRGFLDAAWITSASALVAVADELFAATPLQRLTLDVLTPDPFSKFLRRPYVTRLTSLRYVGGHMHAADRKRLKAMEPGLRTTW
jgi:uncharacterized protein (TIGR02996 family)